MTSPTTAVPGSSGLHIPAPGSRNIFNHTRMVPSRRKLSPNLPAIQQETVIIDSVVMGRIVRVVRTDSGKAELDPDRLPVSVSQIGSSRSSGSLASISRPSERIIKGPRGSQTQPIEIEDDSEDEDGVEFISLGSTPRHGAVIVNDTQSATTPDGQQKASQVTTVESGSASTTTKRPSIVPASATSIRRPVTPESVACPPEVPTTTFSTIIATSRLQDSQSQTFSDQSVQDRDTLKETSSSGNPPVHGFSAFASEHVTQPIHATTDQLFAQGTPNASTPAPISTRTIAFDNSALRNAFVSSFKATDNDLTAVAALSKSSQVSSAKLLARGVGKEHLLSASTAFENSKAKEQAQKQSLGQPVSKPVARVPSLPHAGRDKQTAGERSTEGAQPVIKSTISTHSGVTVTQHDGSRATASLTKTISREDGQRKDTSGESTPKSRPSPFTLARDTSQQNARTGGSQSSEDASPEKEWPALVESLEKETATPSRNQIVNSQSSRPQMGTSQAPILKKSSTTFATGLTHPLPARPQGSGPNKSYLVSQNTALVKTGQSTLVVPMNRSPPHGERPLTTPSASSAPVISKDQPPKSTSTLTSSPILEANSRMSNPTPRDDRLLSSGNAAQKVPDDESITSTRNLESLPTSPDHLTDQQPEVALLNRSLGSDTSIKTSRLNIGIAIQKQASHDSPRTVNKDGHGADGIGLKRKVMEPLQGDVPRKRHKGKEKMVDEIIETLPTPDSMTGQPDFAPTDSWSTVPQFFGFYSFDNHPIRANASKTKRRGTLRHQISSLASTVFLKRNIRTYGSIRNRTLSSGDEAQQITRLNGYLVCRSAEEDDPTKARLYRHLTVLLDEFVTTPSSINNVKNETLKGKFMIRFTEEDHMSFPVTLKPTEDGHRVEVKRSFTLTNCSVKSLSEMTFAFDLCGRQSCYQPMTMSLSDMDFHLLEPDLLGMNEGMQLETMITIRRLFQLDYASNLPLLPKIQSPQHKKYDVPKIWVIYKDDMRLDEPLESIIYEINIEREDKRGYFCKYCEYDLGSQSTLIAHLDLIHKDDFRIRRSCTVEREEGTIILLDLVGPSSNVDLDLEFNGDLMIESADVDVDFDLTLAEKKAKQYGLFMPVMKGRRDNKWTSWSIAIQPGTVRDLMPALDQIYDGGRTRWLMRWKEEKNIWSIHYEELKRERSVATSDKMLTNRFPTKGGSCFAVGAGIHGNTANSRAWIEGFYHKYGEVMRFAEIDHEPISYVTSWYNLHVISQEVYFKTTALWAKIMRTYRKLKGVVPLPGDRFSEDEDPPDLPEFQPGGREYERMKRAEQARKEGREPSPERYKFPREEMNLEDLVDDDISDFSADQEEVDDHLGSE